MPGFDVDAVEALGEALADADGRGDAFRAEPRNGVELMIPDSVRLAYRMRAQTLLERVRATGFNLDRAR